MAQIQLELPMAVIEHKVEKTLIHQRVTDGYVNATAMCNHVGKKVADYIRLSNTKEFLQELSSDMGIPVSELIQVIKGGIPELQGTKI